MTLEQLRLLGFAASYCLGRLQGKRSSSEPHVAFTLYFLQELKGIWPVKDLGAQREFNKVISF